MHLVHEREDACAGHHFIGCVHEPGRRHQEPLQQGACGGFEVVDPCLHVFGRDRCTRMDIVEHLRQHKGLKNGTLDMQRDALFGEK